MKEEEIIKKIKQFAIEVYKTLGAGYGESVYEEALAIEMRRANVSYEIERNTEIIYKDEKVGIHKLDFVVEEKVVVELKAGTSIQKSHRSQLISYLKTHGLKNGLLINFAYPEIEEPEMEEISI